MQKVPMLRLWKTHETMHINFLLLEKFNKCCKKNYLLQCAQPMSVMKEIRSQRKKLCQRNLPGLSIKLMTPNQMMSYIYLMYSEADSVHTKCLVEPQLREGESSSGQQNHANRLQFRGQLTNYERLQKALKTEEAWKTSKLQ